MTHILIVTSRFYPALADEMVRGATAALTSQGATCDVVEVPGAFEIPAAIGFALHNERFDGFVALGCVIRGETTHYDYVCAESARGLMDLSLRGAAVGYGILTVETEEQAWARARITEGDKGRDAGMACLRMIALKRHYASAL